MALPGNPGLAELATIVDGVSPTDPGAVAAIARLHRVDLVVVGPEAPLAAGVVDALEGVGIPAFGPSRAAARLEASKTFAKEVMAAAGVPTAAAHTFDDPSAARAHLEAVEGPYVVKADGLAAGKGVLVTDDRSEALAWVTRCFGGGFGEAGARVVIEEYLEGPELSVFAVCSGRESAVLEPARDYKRLAEGDAGPNTGGMGSFSPVELPAGLVGEVVERVIRPTLHRLADDGTPYLGFLYAGLALTRDGPKVIEFNVRLGDPETQVVLPRLESDLLAVIVSALEGRLGAEPLVWSPRAAVNVVLASAGYPESPRSGDVIHGLEAAAACDDVLVFHAGTARDDRRRLVTAGGRVLSAVGLGDDLEAARTRAYEAVDLIRWEGMQYRRDIGRPPAPP